MEILEPGFENLVRAKLGVSEYELPDADINNIFISEMAESVIKKRVPDYKLITDEEDLLYLKNAVLSYICYLLAPSMPNRIKVDVQTIDVRWKKDKVDWEANAQKYLNEVEAYLSNITTVDVIENVIPVLLDIKKGNRIPIGGD
jgi:hypothetical protein